MTRWPDEPGEAYETYRRHVRRNLEDTEDEMRVRPPRSYEEVQEYQDRLSAWIQALLAQHLTTEEQPFTTELAGQWEREMDAMPVKVRRLLNRLMLQQDVLAWVMNTSLDDLVGDTRDEVEEAGVDMYELEDHWVGGE